MYEHGENLAPQIGAARTRKEREKLLTDSSNLCNTGQEDRLPFIRDSNGSDWPFIFMLDGLRYVNVFTPSPISEKRPSRSILGANTEINI